MNTEALDYIHHFLNLDPEVQSEEFLLCHSNTNGAIHNIHLRSGTFEPYIKVEKSNYHERRELQNLQGNIYGLKQLPTAGILCVQTEQNLQLVDYKQKKLIQKLRNQR